jgi:hypothetical protein
VLKFSKEFNFFIVFYNKVAETAEDFIAELLSTNRFEDRNLKERQLEAVFHVNSEIGGIFSGCFFIFLIYIYFQFLIN